MNGKKGSYHDDLKKFLEFLPISKLTKEITEIKQNFEWRYLPTWSQRREKLLELLKTPFKKESITGVLIEHE